MSQLPHRYRFDQFKRYEIYINHAVESYPQATKCIPKLFNVSQITFVARLRDAMKSLWENQWETYINKIKFREIYNLIQVTERVDGTILVGTKEAIKGWMQQDRIPEVEIPITRNVLFLDKPEVKNFLMSLSHQRFLQPRLKICGLTEEEITEYQQIYDIAIDKNPDGTYTLI